jgi:prepilin-type N-terminal cleavage/methylation domain-containing protein
MTICTTKPEPGRQPGAGGFTLVELMIAMSLAGLVLAAVLGTYLQLIRSGLQLSRHAEMESQARIALETLGNDLRNSKSLIWHSDTDITLTVVASDGSTSEVTYAWTPGSQSLFSVPGGSSASNTGRRYLATKVPQSFNGNAGLRFRRFDRDNAPAASDQLTKRIQVDITLVRDTPTVLPVVSHTLSAGFILRNKTAF